MDYDCSFGQWVINRRKQLRLQRTELATQIGCAAITLRKIESDERRPSQQLALLLADRLKLTPPDRSTFVQVARGELPADHLPLLPLKHAIDLPPNKPIPAPNRPTIRTNLPAPLTSFVGRKQELAVIPALVQAHRLVTLTGVGGVGKTRLALEVGIQMVKQAPIEIARDGIWLVELAALAQPTLVIQAIAQLFQIPEHPSRTTLELLQEYLAEKYLLLILDNCEHLVDVCAELAEQLLQRCWHLRILATSREPLRIPGEYAYPVVPLTVPNPREQRPEQILSSSAAQLFVARMHAHLPTPNAHSNDTGAIAQICRQLDGIPLALELAAPLAQSMPLAEIASQLQHQMAILTNTYRTAIPRHQTMHSALVWSYRLLAPAEQSLLASVAVFAGGWTLEAAQAICSECPTERVLPMLNDLITKSLVVQEELPGQWRYRLLEPVRQFAQIQLQASSMEEVVQRRHAEYFLTLAEQMSSARDTPHEREWLQRLEKEHDNLRATLEWSIAHKLDDELGVRLAVALGLFWQVRGYLSEGRKWLNIACTQLINGTLSTTLAARAFHRAGLLAVEQDDRVQAQMLLGRSLDLYRQLGDEQGMAAALTGLARADTPSALALHTEALALRRKHNHLHGIAESLRYLAGLAHEKGQDLRVINQYKEALAIYRNIEDTRGIADALAGLSEVLHDWGDHEQARTLREESLLLCRELGYKPGVAWSLFNLARFACDQDDYAHAQELCQESITLFNEIGNPWGLAWCVYIVGILAQRQADYDQATDLITQSLSMFRTCGDPAGITACLARLNELQMNPSQ